jgi:iron complex transport system permease protein
MRDKQKAGLFTIAIIILVAFYLFAGLNINNWDYAFSRRIPKLIAIILTGCSIAFSTVVFQTITNNRILTPSILGLDSLYMFIQTVVVFMFGAANLTAVSNNLNFMISVSIMVIGSVLLYKILFNEENNNIYFLLLVGLIFGTLFHSLTSFIQMLIDPNEFAFIQNKMFASFNNINTQILLLAGIVIAVVFAYSFIYIKVLDVLALGRAHAINLGIAYDILIKRMLVVIVILVSVSTALVGPITFLGLLVANLAREIISTFKHRYLIATSVLIGVFALVGGQFLIERVINLKTPLSVIINFVGGLYFIYLLIKENKR